MAPKKRPVNACREFQNTGTCKYGSKCKFAHATSGPVRPGQPVRTTRPASGSRNSGRRTEDGKLKNLKRLLDQGATTFVRNQATVMEVFKTSLELIDGDVGMAQDAIKVLLTEEGYGFVKAVMDRNIPDAKSINDKIAVWNTQLSPLFQIATHPHVVGSSLMEQEVGTLFNVFLGVGGRRMTTVFTWLSPVIDMLGNAQMEAVRLSLAVMARILDYNSASSLNSCVREYANHFSQIVDGSSDDSETTLSQFQARKYLKYIRLRIAVGEGIPLAIEVEPPTLDQGGFVLQLDFPGTLSRDGARHDNDDANIEKIGIMPTMEEIRSVRAEYLPTTDSKQWHKQGIQGRLDREFRLLREDTVGQLRDAIRDKLEDVQQQAQGRPVKRQPRNGLRTAIYDSPRLVAIDFDKNTGLELVVQFQQPEVLNSASLEKRREWWTHGKRLLEGALVCIVDSAASVLYFEVSDATRRTGPKETNAPQEEDNGKVLSLADNKDLAHVVLHLVDASEHNVGQVMRWYRSIGQPPRRYIIEFPGVLLASFKYTLQALQEMHRQPDVPFSHLIAPTDAQSNTEMGLPLYASSRQFAFCLKSSRNDGGVSLSLREEATDNEVAQIMKRTGLDQTQSEAFASTMRRELSLIQGPPGTGKSYTGEKIIRMLIDHRQQAKLGPILCVCYTNHALDQLLEHLLKNGIDKLIRIGSRSKSEQLAGYNLREVAKGQIRTKAEGRSLYDLYGDVDGQVDHMRNLLTQLSVSNSQQSIKQLMKLNYPQHYQELFGDDDSEGFTTVRHRPESVISDWLRNSPRGRRTRRPLNQLLNSSLLSMSSAERYTIHHFWLREIRDPIIAQIIRTSREHSDTREHMGRVRHEVDLRCLQEAHVVGLTTTGLARNVHLLRKLRCKVLVCEEAGEVLEAHILTALLPSVEHAILIGDHQQLRPQIQNYGLQSTNPRGARYSLDVSLFERLVQPLHGHDIQLPFQTLETQRRMHPSIAALIRSTLYPRLVDGANVQDYPEIPGMKHRLFWFHHEELEAAASAQDANSTSHWNAFEVEMTVALVSHLVRQGVYNSEDIAVITPYLGQLHKLRHRMESIFEVCLNQRDQEDLEAFETEVLDGKEAAQPSPVAKRTLLRSLRVATVDNFQGEEAKVVVVSLVRSNPQNRCGFLSTNNRINVLLSRAEHGMYLLGNAATYGHVSMWANVIDMLKTHGSFGTSFELQCPRHPSTPIFVSQPDHFVQRSPESGCALPCEKRYACGHRCHGRCHSDMLHAASKCLEPCPRPRSGCDHACPQLCGDPCPDRCVVRLAGTQLTLPCGHILSSPLCWQKQDPPAVRCTEPVDRDIPGCQHTVHVRCFEDTKTDRYRCKTVCGHQHPCGHACKRPCFHCRTRKDGQVMTENHGACEQPCGRRYNTCQHSCQQKCHSGTPCGPCKAPCETRCHHSQCSKLCNEPCSPCAEKTCSSRCQHSQCTMPCGAPCDWVPCSLRCGKVLQCGHPCPSVCGEVCPEPKYCQTCGSENIRKTVVDFLEMKEYREINLDEEPCIFPQCGHFLTMASMDGMMDMAVHYNINEQGLPSSIKASTKPFSMDEVKVCATCRKSLGSIGRYGRIVRRAMLDEVTKKFITWSDAEYAALSEELLDEQTALKKVPKKGPEKNTLAGRPKMTDTSTPKSAPSRAAQMQTLSQLVGNNRYKSIMRLWKKIGDFTKRVRKEEQPFQRVKEHVESANRHHATRGDFSFDESIIQLKGTLLAGNLMLRCELAVLFDFFQGRTEGTLSLAKDTKLDLSTHRADCQGLITIAHKTSHPLQEVEGHVYLAQLCHFSRAVAQENQPAQTPLGEKYQADGLAHVELARALIASMGQSPAAARFQVEVDAADRLLRDGVFYSQMTDEEMRAVYKAMASGFRGTGHWYNCEKGHPFTIGECGMPMELARCPECNSPIGGQDHEAVAGVRHAQDIERLGADFRRVNL